MLLKRKHIKSACWIKEIKIAFCGAIFNIYFIGNFLLYWMHQKCPRASIPLFWARLLKFKTISSKYIFFLVKPAVSPQSHLPLTSHTLSGPTHFGFPNCQRLIFLKIFTSINETKHLCWEHKSKKSKHWGPLLLVIYKMTWWPFFLFCYSNNLVWR